MIKTIIFSQKAIVRLAYLFIFLLFVIGAAESNSMNIIWPATPDHDMNSTDNGSHEVSYIRREGKVVFAVDLFLPESEFTHERIVPPSSFSGLDLSLIFFPDQQFTIIVDSDSRPVPDILILSGYIQGTELSTFSLTITPETFLITLQNLDSALVYRVTGNTETGMGKVSEIDLNKMPPVYHLPPLIPPDDIQ